jgi:hypothetical protein
MAVVRALWLGDLVKNINMQAMMGMRSDVPLSSHHFLRSELAGGRPGSMLSYPNRSSSSDSSSPR